MANRGRKKEEEERKKLLMISAKVFGLLPVPRSQAPPSFSLLAVAMESWAGPVNKAVLSEFLACCRYSDIELQLPAYKTMHFSMAVVSHGLTLCCREGCGHMSNQDKMLSKIGPSIPPSLSYHCQRKMSGEL